MGALSLRGDSSAASPGLVCLACALLVDSPDIRFVPSIRIARRRLGGVMLNKPGLFGQNDRYRRDSRGLEPANPAPAENTRSDPVPTPAAALEMPKVEPVKAKVDEPM